MDDTTEDLTRDAILGGTLTIHQPRRGYRFSVDSILLGRFATVRARDRVLDLGAGGGVVAIMIAALARPREVIALELQPQLAALIDRNATLNSLTNVRGVCADIRARRNAGIEPASFDLIVANPPYYAAARGRHSPGEGRRAARSGTDAELADFVAAARRYARNAARVAFVFAANRSAELIATMRARELEPKRIRFVHPRVELPAASVLVEARVGGGVEVAVEPPLILYDNAGEYSAEARALLLGARSGT
ncbi:MAG TPA: methyltransferase [Candidatus Binataceae bacterium]|nr:methyltransferase [Candidatus Binataceae bacterium]